MRGASGLANGASGYVPTPTAGQQAYFLQGDGTWASAPAGSLPSSTGNGGKVLTTDGVTNSWSSSTTALNSIVSSTGTNLVLGTGTFGTALTLASATGAATFAGSITSTTNSATGTANPSIATLQTASNRSAYFWVDPTQAVDEKAWDIALGTKQLVFRNLADSYGSASVYFALNRGTGTALGSVVVNTPLSISIGTASNSTTTGSFINAGGFGNAGAAYIGGLITAGASGGDNLFGNSVANNSVTVTRTGANASSLSMQAFTDIPAITYIGTTQALRFISNATERFRFSPNNNLLIGTVTDTAGSNGLVIAGTTDSTSNTTGALIVAGGGAFAKALTIGASSGTQLRMLGSSNSNDAFNSWSAESGTGVQLQPFHGFQISRSSSSSSTMFDIFDNVSTFPTNSYLRVRNSTGTMFAILGASGAVSITPLPRTSGVASYFTLTPPTDTGITAATESIGVSLPTATRTWATTGTVALQRERFFAGPTYASASASQTFTDAFNLYLTPPIAGTNAIITRNHTLGILDSTSAASSITGGLIVATALGTAATSVGIGGGNVNAGGLITGGTITSTGAFTASSTSAHNGAATFSGSNASTAVTITQTARTSGVLPYLQITTPTDTGQTAATESPGVRLSTGTRTWATTGTVALQREVLFSAPTYASAAASQTFTKAATVSISGAPIAGTNAIITQGFALNVESGNTSLGGLVQHGGLTRTTTGFTATSNITLANVTGLSATVLAGQTYHFRVWAPTTATAAGGIQFAIAGTATATNITYEGYIDGATKTRAAALGTAVSSSAAATTGTATIEGTITVANAGTLTVQFAQNTSNVAASTVLQGATFEVFQTIN
jgi:hypothetical protein